MSCDIMTRVRFAQTEPTQKLALLDLADNTGEGYEWGVGIATLAAVACCTEIEAREALQKLQQLGWLENVRETRAGYFEGAFSKDAIGVRA